MANQSQSSHGSHASKGRRNHAERKFKFRKAGTSLHDFTFKTDQVWVRNAGEGSIKFIGHRPRRRPVSHRRKETPTDKDAEDHAENEPPSLHSAGMDEGLSTAAFGSHIGTADSHSPSEAGLGFSSPVCDDAALGSWPLRETDPSQHPDSNTIEIPCENHALLHDTENFHERTGRTHFIWPEAFETHHCACLMHFFIEKIVPAADIGDPLRNGALVVPSRARVCPPLMNAILTCAAIALFSSPKYRTKDGVCQYRGVLLPSLTYARIVQHHNACVANLLELCDNSAFAEDENLLAALVSLRFHEEMDSRYQTGEDKERLLSSLRIFLNAQTKIILQHTNPPLPAHGAIDHPALPSTPSLEYLKSFRHSLFRNALRQELTAAYMGQRGVQYPLEAWSFLDTLDSSEYEDLIWSDRHLLHCARVLDFCYDSSESDAVRNVQRWRELKDYEERWEETMPTSFLPLFEEKPCSAPGQLLYRVWYLSTLHLTAIQFFELARILLLATDPTIPRLGPRAVAAKQRMSSEIKRIVLHVCSIATSYEELTPAWVQASMAIFIGGEFFTDPGEQDVLLAVLHRLEKDHGWPSSHIAIKLNHAWKRGLYAQCLGDADPQSISPA